jgi:hypothetical protein
MPTTQASMGMSVLNGTPSLMRKTLLMAVKMWEPPKLIFYKRICGKIFPTLQAYEELALVSGLTTPQIVGEYQDIPTDDLTTPYTKRTQPQKRALQFRVSDEAFENDRYGIIKEYGTLLMEVFIQAREIAAAVYLNGCTTVGAGTYPQSTATSITCPSGQPLSSAAHPLDALAVPATDSNTFAIQQTLGIIALEDAAQNLRNQRAHKGYPAPKIAPFTLEVAPRNGLVAQRLVRATQLPTTNNNDPNPVGGYIGDIVDSPYFTNPEWWSLRCMAVSDQPRFMLSRYGFKVMPIDWGSYNRNNDSWEFTAKESYAFDVKDYRGVFYSTPS